MACSTDGINDQKRRNEKWCWFIAQESKQGQWIPVGSTNAVKNGEYVLFYCNGNIRQKGTLRDGKDSDTIFFYDIDESLISRVFRNREGELLEIMRDGKYRDYYPTCEVRSEGEIFCNEQISVRNEFYRGGQIRKRSWRSGDTTWLMNYYQNGVLKDSSLIITGKYSGISKSWYDNGNLEAIRQYRQNLRHGIFVFYHENGQLKQTRKFIEDVPEDTVKDWYDNGQLRFVKQYSNGKKEGLERTWYRNGI